MTDFELKVESARTEIAKEFIETFHEWLKDVTELTESEYWATRKYDLRPADGADIKDNQKWLLWFQKNVYSGRWLPHWELAGYDKQVIWALHRDGFLSYQWYSNALARATGRTDFYYISQNTAKQIYKQYK